MIKMPSWIWNHNINCCFWKLFISICALLFLITLCLLKLSSLSKSQGRAQGFHKGVPSICLPTDWATIDSSVKLSCKVCLRRRGLLEPLEPSPSLTPESKQYLIVSFLPGPDTMGQSKIATVKSLRNSKKWYSDAGDPEVVEFGPQLGWFCVGGNGWIPGKNAGFDINQKNVLSLWLHC